MSWLGWLKNQALRFEREVSALALAWRDPRVTWPTRLVVALVLLYIISPIDLIPESAHVLGGLDDLIMLPLGLFIAVRLVPKDVMADCRARAITSPFRDLRWWVVVLIVVAWQVFTVMAARWWAE